MSGVSPVCPSIIESNPMLANILDGVVMGTPVALVTAVLCGWVVRRGRLLGRGVVMVSWGMVTYVVLGMEHTT